MTYKVAALRNVTILANIRGQRRVNLGGQFAMIPSESKQWVTLRAGESLEGLGMPVGIHPASAPGEMPIHTPGLPAFVTMDQWSDATLPQEFLGLFRLEVESDS